MYIYKHITIRIYNATLQMYKLKVQPKQANSNTKAHQFNLKVQHKQANSNTKLPYQFKLHTKKSFQILIQTN